MSTEYYTLQKPITSIKVKMNAVHSKITIYDPGFIGELTIKSENYFDYICMFFDRSYYVARRVGMREGKCKVTFYENLDDSTILLDDRGDLTTVEELKKEGEYEILSYRKK